MVFSLPCCHAKGLVAAISVWYAGLSFCGFGLLGGQGEVFGQSGSPVGAPIEFSAKMTWRVGGKTQKAQLFVQNDRYRIEHLSGIKTDLGYASVTIVRLDQQKIWYVISQRRLVMAVPLSTDFLLPFSVRLEGEVSRVLLGEGFVADQPAQLYEVGVDREGHRETYYEWVDPERNILLKLVSQDRDWSVEYEHVVLSKQPDYFFNPPLGYQTYEAITRQAEKG